MHKVPWLWRLHRVHHADVDVDVTTGVRFHPLEYLLSLGLKGGAAVLIGAPVGAVVAVRGAAQRDLDVQPREPAAAGAADRARAVCCS